MPQKSLPTKRILTLELAMAIAEAAHNAAIAKQLNKIVIAVTDDGGRLVYLMRQDGAEPAAVDIGIAKAHGAAIFTKPTKHWKDLLLEGKYWVLGMPNMTPVEGGLPIMIEGQTIGGLGIAGASGALDTEIGTAGLAACSGFR